MISTHYRSSALALLLLSLSGSTTHLVAATDNSQANLRSSTTQKESINAATQTIPSDKKKVVAGLKPDAGFGMGAGVKCDGGAWEHKGYYMKCEGGLKGGYFQRYDDAVVSQAEEESLAIATRLHDHIQKGGYLLTVNDFMPSQDVVEQVDALEKDDTVEFGGFYALGWGCKLTDDDEEDMDKYSAECGVKGMKGMGMKPMVDLSSHSSVGNDVHQSVSVLVDDTGLYDFCGEDDCKPKPDAVFHVEKGVKCGGAQWDDKGDVLKCEGGIKFTMTKKSPDDPDGPEDKTLLDVAQAMYSHMNEGYMLTVEQLMTQIRVPVSTLLMNEEDDDEYYEDDDDDDEMEVGGLAKMSWGCKATGIKSGEKIAVECGMKSVNAVGVKEGEADEVVESNTIATSVL